MKRIFAITAPKEKPFWSLSVPDAAQRLIPFAVSQAPRGVERAMGHRPGAPSVMDYQGSIGDPGGD
jgi:hypothetical protein